MKDLTATENQGHRASYLHLDPEIHISVTCKYIDIARFQCLNLNSLYLYLWDLTSSVSCSGIKICKLSTFLHDQESWSMIMNPVSYVLRSIFYTPHFKVKNDAHFWIGNLKYLTNMFELGYLFLPTVEQTSLQFSWHQLERNKSN